MAVLFSESHRGSEEGENLKIQPGVRYLVSGPALLHSETSRPITVPARFPKLERHEVSKAKDFFLYRCPALEFWIWPSGPGDLVSTVLEDVKWLHSRQTLSLSKRYTWDAIWLRSRSVEKKKNTTRRVFYDRSIFSFTKWIINVVLIWIWPLIHTIYMHECPTHFPQSN